MTDRVLLVDDDESILFALRRIVASRGWEPLVAHSGEEALRLVDRADVIVTDLCMPGMDGFELIAAVHEVDEALPVILLTADTHLEAEARLAGAHDYLTKPFGITALASAIERALEARRLRPAAGAAGRDRATA